MDEISFFEYHSERRLSEQTLEDMGILSLLKTFLNQQQLESVTHYLCRIPPHDEIKRRQEFFESCFHDRMAQEYLKTAESYFRHLHRIKTFYLDKTDTSLYHIRYAVAYCRMIEGLTSINIAFTDSILTHVFAIAKSEQRKTCYCELKNQLRNLFQILEKYRRTALWIQTSKSEHKAAAVMPEVQKATYAKRLLDGLETVFHIEMKEKREKLSLSEADKYLSFLGERFSEVKSALQCCTQFCSSYPFLQTENGISDGCIIDSLRILYDFLKRKSIPLCLPRLSENARLHILNGFDISLLKTKDTIVPNDFYAETYLSLVHGTNSGGKTAFLQMIGICTIFALVGFYVPANEMTIPYIGCVYTAFAQDEAIHAGRLTNEQKRMDKILSETRAYDLVLVNEIYSSTNQKESAELSNEILKKFHENCCYVVWNSHQDYDLHEKTFSILLYTPEITSTNEKTFKIVRSDRCDTKSQLIAASYGLTYNDLIKKWRQKGWIAANDAQVGDDK